MSIIGIGLNLLLAILLGCALAMGWRLNRRLGALREGHEGFAVAVRELNAAAERAERGLAELRGATDEAVDLLADRIEKGRSLAARLERLTAQAPAHLPEAAAAPDPHGPDRRLGALLAAARAARGEKQAADARRPAPAAHRAADDDLFEPAAAPLRLSRGGGR